MALRSLLLAVARLALVNGVCQEIQMCATPGGFDGTRTAYEGCFDPADPRVVHTCMKGEHVEMVTDHPSASPLMIAVLITAANPSRVHEEP